MSSLRRLLLVGLAALAAAACAVTSSGSPNVAATVGDRTITTQRVEDTLDSFRDTEAFRQQEAADESGDFILDLQSQIVSSFIQSELLEVGAERQGIEVSDDDVQSALDDLIQQAGGQEAFDEMLQNRGLNEELALRQVRDQRLVQSLQESIEPEVEFADWLRDQTADVPVEVNPRFGTWDHASLSVVRPGATTPQPTASP